MDVVFVKWADTVGDSENMWKDIESSSEFFDRDDNIAEEVGFVLAEDDENLCLCSGWMPGDVPITRNRTKIPKRCIIEQRVLVGDKKEDDDVH